MTTEVNTLQWQKTLSLDRHVDPPLYQHGNRVLSSRTLPRFLQEHQRKRQFDLAKLIIDVPPKDSPLLYSVGVKEGVLESRRVFLGLSDGSDRPQERRRVDESVEKVDEVACLEAAKRSPQKKISFKIKKTSSVYRRNLLHPPRTTVLSANTVAELTSKFNKMVAEKNAILEEPKFARLVKRVNSQKSNGEKPKVSRKPSVKTKPNFAKGEDVQKKKAFVKRKVSSAKKPPQPSDKPSDKVCVRAKISYLEVPRTVKTGREAANAVPLKGNLEENRPPSNQPPLGSVKAAIEIFERRSSQTVPPGGEAPKTVPKPKVPERTFGLLGRKDVVEPKPKPPEKPKATTQQTLKTEEANEEVQIVAISPTLPQRRCDSMYETLNLKKTTPSGAMLKLAKSDLELRTGNAKKDIKPNSSFLWRRSSSQEKAMALKPDAALEELYDTIQPPEESLQQKPKPPTPPRSLRKSPLSEENPDEDLSKLYEELGHDYEYCDPSSVKYEDVEENPDDGYEYCRSENIYEVLPANPPQPPSLPRRKEDPLPPRPQSRDSNLDYESIYNASQKNYESIYDARREDWGSVSNRNSLLSCDQQSNSIYGRSSSLLGGWGDDVSAAYDYKTRSDLSSSDKSDDWIDMSDGEDNGKDSSAIVIVREKQKNKKTPGWSRKLREQWSKSPQKVAVDPVDSDSDHHYESLWNAKKESQEDDFDSFDSDSESENSFNKTNFNDSGVDVGNASLPDPPSNQPYVLTRLAASAGKHMKRLRRNWSLTKNDITKSLSRMRKKKSRTDLASSNVKSSLHDSEASSNSQDVSPQPPDEAPVNKQKANESVHLTETSIPLSGELSDQGDGCSEKSNKNSARRGFLDKFRRSMSISTENANELTNNLNSKTKSTFYLTETIDIDGNEKAEMRSGCDSGLPSSPVHKTSKHILRPHSPPPPTPVGSDNKKINKKEKRSTSWYAECGLFKGTDSSSLMNKRPNTYWYAEVGLYQTSASTPSTSSAENSGNNYQNKTTDLTKINQEDDEKYYNMKNENDYYNESIQSFSSGDTKLDRSFTNISSDMQLRLQDEPLYQFYDAAVLESACQEGSEFDSDGYEEVGNKKSASFSSRPSAMELVAVKDNSLSVSRTLWCEIPEVIQSSVLSTMSAHQRKLQEAKFEMITSEASYLNSLNVLINHLIPSFTNSEMLTETEKNLLFGKIRAVKDCSERLLSDLENCWQDNILLHGVCDIILKHAEENFSVYVSYCENQILLDRTLKRLKERNSFLELLRQLELNSACQSLTLYSFLMLPMQRITRWPLLIDAVLKRLSSQDSEYLTCQYALASINKVVMQCNEGARKVERETEMEQIAKQIEFPRTVSPIQLVSGSRWLVRSGPLTQMTPKNDETKLTFGRRFSKVPLHLFLFNDLLLITKCKTEDNYIVLHYCSRSLVELNTSDILISLPAKEAQGRHLLFLTLLENHEQKTVEFLLSCSSESHKERWIEALSAPKSEDPDETLYECWDCPQVTAVHSYMASQPDELPLCKGDIINVTRKMADGWYHGERIRDRETGWFPANYTVEVVNPHVRARNLKQRYRLLAFSENYLKSK